MKPRRGEDTGYAVMGGKAADTAPPSALPAAPAGPLAATLLVPPTASGGRMPMRWKMEALMSSRRDIKSVTEDDRAAVLAGVRPGTDTDGRPALGGGTPPGREEKLVGRRDVEPLPPASTLSVCPGATIKCDCRVGGSENGTRSGGPSMNDKVASRGVGSASSALGAR